MERERGKKKEQDEKCASALRQQRECRDRKKKADVWLGLRDASGKRSKGRSIIQYVQDPFDNDSQIVYLWFLTINSETLLIML